MHWPHWPIGGNSEPVSGALVKTSTEKMSTVVMSTRKNNHGKNISEEKSPYTLL